LFLLVTEQKGVLMVDTQDQAPDGRRKVYISAEETKRIKQDNLVLVGLRHSQPLNPNEYTP
jgi:hypothetical protein